MRLVALLAALAPLTATAELLVFSNATDGRNLATLSSDTLTWTGCRDAEDAEELSGDTVSSTSFTCPSVRDTLPLMRAVPGTTLVNLVLNGSFSGVSDPYLDTNLAMFPDVSGLCPSIATLSGNCPWVGNDTDAGRAFYTFWWRTEFTITDFDMPGERFWLHLRGINYRASVFLNGVELKAEAPTPGPERGDPEQRTIEVASMYHRFVFDASAAIKPGIGTKNILAILVKPPDVVGTADQPGFLLGGGQGGNHGMAQNGAVMQYTEGWDWAVGTADRNTGLWDLIQIERIRSPVTIRYPHVVTVSVSCASTSGDSAESAVVAVSAIVQNLAHADVSGELSFQFLDTEVEGGSGKVEVTIPAGSSVEAKLPQLMVRNAALWWPQPLGKPALHRVRLEFIPGTANTASTVRDLRVGLRTAEAVVEPNSDGRSFLINGKPIFLAGGNWIGTDQLLRYSTDRQRYYDEVRMHKEMGMNIIRVWGGALTERPEFYEAADELGVLVMQEFWMTGDNNGRWAGSNDWPNNHPLYLSSVVDMIRMLRNHPSLLFWCGGNELLPPKEAPGWQMNLIDHTLRSLVSELDSRRFYIPSSMGTYKVGTHNNTFSLAPSDGPYNILDEQKYYTAGAGGGTVDAGGDETGGGIVFQPETGNIATPTYASMQRFLSPEVVADFPQRGADPEGHVNGSNVVWNYHKYITTTEKGTEFDHIYLYGPPADTAAYCKRGQLVLFTQYKALYEGYMEHLFASAEKTAKGIQFGYTAVIMWKSQSPWPALRGALYDSYLATTGGFWGTQAALQPIHLQLNLHTMALTVVNMKAESCPSMFAVVRAYALPSGNELTLPERLARVVVSPLGPVSRTRLIDHHVPWPEDAAPEDSVVLYRLQLFDAVADPERATPIDSNDYWLSHPEKHQDYSKLALSEHTAGGSDATAVVVNAKPVLGGTPQPSGRQLEVEYELTLTNQGKKTAFGCWLEVTNMTDLAATGTEERNVVFDRPHIRSESDRLSQGVPVERRLLPVWFDKNLFHLLPGEQIKVHLRLSQFSVQAGLHNVALSGWNVKDTTAVLPPPNQI